MATREVTVAAAVGLHARPAARLARAAGEAERDGHVVLISRPGGPPAKASSIVALMTLAARHGETLVLDVSGERADQALDQLAALITSEEEA